MKINLAAAFVVVLIAAGLLLAGMNGRETTACTEMGCPCIDDGERPCNSCTIARSFFSTVVLDLVYECSATEILICEKGMATEKRISEKKDCRMETYVLGFDLKYIGKNPEGTSSNKPLP